MQHGALPVFAPHARVGQELISFLRGFLRVAFIRGNQVHVIDVTLGWVWPAWCCVTLLNPVQPLVDSLLKDLDRP